MFDGWSVFIVIALCAAVAFAVATFARVGRLVRERDGAAREAGDLRARLEAFAQASAQHERDMREDLAAARREQADAAVTLRREVGERLSQLAQGSEQRLEAVRSTVEQRLDVLRSESAHKLEQMRVTVDEKLQATLDQRLGESFRLVSERLEQVHRGLGEMQTLAVGVGDLKRVLTNVKTRGTWGEVQLGALLSEVLTPQQYATNVETIPGSNRRIEYAIRLPGRGDDDTPCWLPIDAKFPLDHWQRLQDALERADLPAAEDARRALESFLRQQARAVRAQYVAAPHTTDFAVLFLPLESLYAEMMARPGLADSLQRDFRVMLTGPNNFLALLNIVQMGFRTLAIEQRSSEVWRTLGAVKTEFAKFGDVLAKIKERLDRASQEIENAGVRRRVLERHLRTVEALPEPETARLLGAELNLDLDLEAPPDEK
jgi:DNA recombination protein RmuC